MNHLTEEQIASVLDASSTDARCAGSVVAAHLASCASCARAVALARALDSAVAELPVAEVGADFTARVMAEVAAIGPKRHGARYDARYGACTAARVLTAPTVSALTLGVMLLALMALRASPLPGDARSADASVAARAVDALSSVLSHPAFVTTATAIAAVLVLIGLDPLFERRMLRSRDRSRS